MMGRHYLTLMKFTEQGSKDLKGAPQRIEAAIRAWELMGGKFLAVYFLMGEYDYVACATIHRRHRLHYDGLKIVTPAG